VPTFALGVVHCNRFVTIERREGASFDTDRDSAVGVLIGGASGDAACQNFVESDKPGHYAKFERCLTAGAPSKAQRQATSPIGLRTFSPFGVPAAIAAVRRGSGSPIRNGYLNFYRLGQSVARVIACQASSALTCHYKIRIA